jgi:hypothetical protein
MLVSDGFFKGTRLVVACGVFVTSFFYRFFLQPNVNNDFYMHVVRGRQMMLGELPVRDFVDPGLPMMYVVSAVAETVGGHSLLSEITASLIFMSLGAVLVFLLATEASRSQIIGLLITAMVVAIEPRLYGYPKIFCYPLAIWSMWRYVDRPDTVRTVVLAGCTVLAFLFRHDHGLYIGLVVVLAVIIRHWRGGRPDLSRAMMSFTLVTALLLSPYLLFIQVNGGLLAHLRTGVEFGRVEATRNGRELPAWRWEDPVRLVNIRWTPGVASDDASRTEAERRYGLERPDFQGQRTWTYELRRPSRENGFSLIADPNIEDTRGIDRSTGEVGRFGTLVSANALPWLFYLFHAMPLAAIGVLCWRRARGTSSLAGMPRESEKVVVLALLALMASVALLREPLAGRIADVAGLASIVGGWLTGLAFSDFGWASWKERVWVTGPRQNSWRPLAQTGRAAVRCAVAGTLLAVTWLSVVEIGSVGIWLDRTGFNSGVSLARVKALAVDAYRHLSLSPVDSWPTPAPTGLKDLARYIHACTRPTDRLFVSGFFPDVYFFSARGFAGGHGDFIPAFHSSLRDQRLTLARFERQSVPIVLIHDDLARDVPFVDTYLREHYRLVPHVDTQTTGGLSLYVERRRVPTGVYTSLDAPCYS